MSESLSCVTLPSPFGPLSIVWRQARPGPKIQRIFLSSPMQTSQHSVESEFGTVSTASHPDVDALGGRIQAFLSGDAVAFDLALMALERCSEFQRRVLLAEYGIPRGWVSTYGRIGTHLGLEHGGRAVGRALARNPFPIVIPCQRAIRSNGGLGGYQGGLDMKQALLVMEGVPVSESGKVLAHKVYYAP
jgi:methylated-DNA-[protein]-cysteine S-methyltransferase